MDWTAFRRGFARGVAQAYAVAFVVLVLVLLSACGGGGSIEEPSENSPPVNCQAKPEACK